MYKNRLYSVKVLYSYESGKMLISPYSEEAAMVGSWTALFPWMLFRGPNRKSDEVSWTGSAGVHKWDGTVCRASSVLRCTFTFWNSDERKGLS